MSGFVAELVVFFGLITSPKFLLMPKMLITFVMAIGMILTPIYLLLEYGKNVYFFFFLLSNGAPQNMKIPSVKQA